MLMSFIANNPSFLCGVTVQIKAIRYIVAPPWDMRELSIIFPAYTYEPLRAALRRHLHDLKW